MEDTMHRHEEYLHSETHDARGTQYVLRFPNGYGASVVRNRMSYGNSLGLWELAVLDADGDLDYSTPITNDVIGWLNSDEVDDILDQIKALPSQTKALES